jgi:pimeloyl-ACP methyl ester carboxylesterase
LNTLLKSASIPGPFVLVGGGEAGLHIVVYNQLYPSDVAGVVLADSAGIADSDVEEPEFLQGPWARHFGSWAPHFRGAACAVLLPAAHRLGVGRLLWQFQGARRTPAFGLTREQQDTLDLLSDNPTAKTGGELCDREESLSQVREAGDLGDRPLIVLASQRRIGLRPRDPDHAGAVEAYNDNWINKVQPQLAALSTRGRLVTVEDGQVLGRTVEAVREIVREIDARQSSMPRAPRIPR